MSFTLIRKVFRCNRCRQIFETDSNGDIPLHYCLKDKQGVEMDFERIVNWMTVFWLVVGIPLAIFANQQMIGMIFGFGIGLMFGRNHCESRYKDKYLELLEKKEA